MSMPTTGTGSETFCYTTLRFYAIPVPFKDFSIRSSQICLNRIQHCLELEAKILTLEGSHLAQRPSTTKPRVHQMSGSRHLTKAMVVAYIDRTEKLRILTTNNQVKPRI